MCLDPSLRVSNAQQLCDAAAANFEYARRAQRDFCKQSGAQFCGAATSLHCARSVGESFRLHLFFLFVCAEVSRLQSAHFSCRQASPPPPLRRSKVPRSRTFRFKSPAAANRMPMRPLCRLRTRTARFRRLKSPLRPPLPIRSIRSRDSKRSPRNTPLNSSPPPPRRRRRHRRRHQRQPPLLNSQQRREQTPPPPRCRRSTRPRRRWSRRPPLASFHTQRTKAIQVSRQARRLSAKIVLSEVEYHRQQALAFESQRQQALAAAHRSRQLAAASQRQQTATSPIDRRPPSTTSPPPPPPPTSTLAAVDARTPSTALVSLSPSQLEEYASNLRMQLAAERLQQASAQHQQLSSAAVRAAPTLVDAPPSPRNTRLRADANAPTAVAAAWSPPAQSAPLATAAATPPPARTSSQSYAAIDEATTTSVNQPQRALQQLPIVDGPPTSFDANSR